MRGTWRQKPARASPDVQKAALYSAADKAVLAAGKLLLVLLIARALGPEGQGVFAFALALWAMSTTVFSLGLEVANNFYGARQQQYPTAGLLGNTLVFGAASGCAGGIVVYSLTQTPLFPSEFVSYAMYLGAGVPITMITYALGGLLMGNLRFLEKLLANVLLYLGSLATVSYLLVRGSMEIQDVLFYWLSWQTLSTLVVFFVLLRLSGFRVSFDLSILKEQLRYGTYAYVYNISNALNFRFDALVIAYFLGPAAVGLYSVAVAATEVILYVPKALTNVFLAAVSSGRTIPAQVYREILALLILTGAVCTVAAFALFSPVFGPEFASSAPLVAILVIGTVGMGMGNLAAYHMFGFGKSMLPTQAAIASAACVVTADIVLIPYWGLPGAALASTLAYTVFGLLNLSFLARNTSTNTRDYLKPDVVSLYGNLLRMSRPLRRWRWHGQH
jgi:O-antigen/teichoic acid export membrane protein